MAMWKAIAVLAAAGIQAPASGPAATAPHAPIDPLRVVYDRPSSVDVPGGRRRISSMLRVDRAMGFGGYVWHDGAGGGDVWVRVDLERQTLSVFRGGDEIGTSVILFGASDKGTPRGAFRVLERDRDHVSSLYDAPMPFMLRLTGGGVAIHASDVRAGAATHGCVGVPTGFARRLYEVARLGSVVYIV
jgi:hypothetical protein